MLDQIDKGRPLDLLLMVGDQIYADDLSFLHADSFLEQYYARYRDAFIQENIRNIMGRVPTYMILDDHEIEDNWPKKAAKRDFQHKYPHAIHAYQTYQASHSPLLEMEDGRMVGTPDKFWYSFKNGCATFFVMDTRTERFIEGDDPSAWRIVSKTQLKALKDWLLEDSDKIKFVVSGVPFFPDFIGDPSDKWAGFINQRTEILDFIAANEVRKVVFLSGDVHCSLSAQLISEDKKNFKVTSIVSSSLFWPYPQGKQKDFQLKGLLKTQASSRYELVNASEVVSVDNFTRVKARDNTLLVSVYDRKGNEMNSQTIML